MTRRVRWPELLRRPDPHLIGTTVLAVAEALLLQYVFHSKMVPVFDYLVYRDPGWFAYLLTLGMVASRT